MTYLSAVYCMFLYVFFLTDSFPPNITAPEIFLATVGNESVYTFTVISDSDHSINVTVLHGGEDTLPDGVVFNDLDGDSYSITWSADNSTVLNLTIVANDPSNENVSSMFIPTVHLCACENGGNCTTNGLLNTDFTFVVLNCECPEGKCTGTIFEFLCYLFLWDVYTIHQDM